MHIRLLDEFVARLSLPPPFVNFASSERANTSVVVHFCYHCYLAGRILIICNHSSLQLTTWKPYLGETKVSYSLAAWTQPYLNVSFILCTLNSTFHAFTAHWMTDSNVKKKNCFRCCKHFYVDFYFCRIFVKQNLFAILFYLFFFYTRRTVKNISFTRKNLLRRYFITDKDIWNYFILYYFLQIL